jgi:hypothetical protein
VGAKVVVTLLTDDRYGYHRDELYYAIAGRRLAFGYVDFPPVTPLAARAAEEVFGMSLVGLRAPALAAGVAVVLLTAAMAKELGGTARAQWLAALGVTTCAFFLGANGLLQTVSFDTLAWALALYAFVRIATSANPAWWLGLGAAIGFAMLTKFTTPVLVAGIGVGVLVTPVRRALRTPWPWLGAALALVIAAPNLVWQIAHDWPSVDFLRGQNARVSADNPTTKYVTEQLFSLGPFVLVMCAAGVRQLWRGHRERALLWTVVTVEIIYLAFHGKSYYPLDVFPVLIAAGAVSVANWKHWRVIAIGLVAFALVALPIALPVLPQNTMLRYDLDKARDDFSAELGWRTVVSTISRAYDHLSAQERPHAIILTENYSQASAINLLGDRSRLPEALSGHNTYWLWLPPDASIDTVLTVGFRASELRQWFARTRPVGRIPDHQRIDVEERGARLYLCTEPLVSTQQLWRDVKRFS